MVILSIKENKDIGVTQSILAGIGSGIFKIFEGGATLGATLLDLGVDKGSGDLRGLYASGNPAMEQLSYLGFKKAAYDKTQGSGYTGDDAFFARYLNVDELGVGDNPEKYGTKKAK